MAIIIRGESKCLLCGEVMNEGQQLVAFPPFIPNQKDVLAIFSDGAFHASCFHSHPLSDRAEWRYREMIERNGPGHRFCVVCETEIDDPDQYITLGHLTSDKNDPAYDYNYSQAHRRCLPKWPELNHVICLIEHLLLSEQWEGKALEALLSTLRDGATAAPSRRNS